MTDPTFDPRLANQLRAYAEGGVRPIDPLAIAEAAIAAPRRLAHPGFLLLAAALLLGGALAAGLVAGSRLTEATPAGTIAFSTSDGAARSVWRVEASGAGTSEPLTQQTDAEISPDGGHAAYLAPDGVHVVDLATGRTALFPDSATGSLWLDTDTVQLDGQGPTLFAWSADGQWVSWVGCTSDGAAPCSLYVGPTSGATATRLPSPHAPLSGPGFMPASDVPIRIWQDEDHLFVIARLGLDNYVADGSGAVLGNGSSRSSRPWSEPQASGDLILHRADGSFSAVVNWAQPWQAGGPGTWSPTYSMLAVGLFPRTGAAGQPVRAGVGPLSLVAPDGTHREVDLGSDIQTEWNPRWSPDGSKVLVPVVVAASAEAQPTDAVVVDVADMRATRLNDAADVTWSPDGSWLALTPASGPHQVELVRPDGTDRHAVGPIVSGAIDAISWAASGSLQPSPSALAPGPTGSPAAATTSLAASQGGCATDRVHVLTGTAMPRVEASDVSAFRLPAGNGYFLTFLTDRVGGELWETSPGGSDRLAVVTGGGDEDVLELVGVSPVLSSVLLRVGRISPSDASHDCTDLYLVSTVGLGATRLTHNGAGAVVVGGAISPDGRQVAYATRDAMLITDLVSGQLVRQSGCSTPGGQPVQVAWSPAGDRVAVDCAPAMVYDSSGATDPISLGGNAFTFAWRDDDHLQVAWQPPSGSHVGLKVGSFEVTAGTLAYGGPIEDGGTDWTGASGRFSPDGRQLLLGQYVIPAAGGTPRRFSYWEGEGLARPTWSTDSQSVLGEWGLAASANLVASDIATGGSPWEVQLPATYLSGIWEIP